ncbi:MAG: mandelate racemase/muconate lactonizing enzyme family protein [Sediminibacterium sp.]
MKIISIRSSLRSVPLKKPYTIAYNTFSSVDLVLLEIELANGIIGYGSASPAEEVVGESPRQTAQHLQSDMIQQLVGRDIRHFQQLIYEVRQHFPLYPGTQAAIDIALHDAFGKFLGIPVVEWYGQKIKAILTSVTIGIKDVAATLAEAEEYQRKGFRVLKVKTGIELEEDIERITKLYERFGRSMILRVDANQGYTLAQLQRFLEATQSFGIELVEQPLPVGAEQELLQLDTFWRGRIAGDESIKDPAAALRWAAGDQPFGIYNIKLMKCGGLSGAFSIAQIAAAAGIHLFWGCNDESTISITAALHAAYANENTRYLDLDGNFDLQEDLMAGGFRLEDGYMYIGTGAGLGLIPFP